MIKEPFLDFFEMSEGSSNPTLYFIKSSRESNISQVDTLELFIPVGAIFLPKT